MSQAPVRERRVGVFFWGFRGEKGHLAFPVPLRLGERSLRWVESSNCNYVPASSRRVGSGVPGQESPIMKCQVCGGLLDRRVTDLPSKTGDSPFVVLKALPVLQCRQCDDTELEHDIMMRVEQMLSE